MNNIRLLTILALAASLTACQQEPQPPGPNGSGETHSVTLQAVFGDAPAVGTKVAITDTYGANFAWSEGDQIAVHSSDGSYHTLTLMTGAGTASATFEGELNGTQNYYAVYPATAKVDANYGNSTLQVTLPDSYTIDGSMGTTSQLPMIAVNTGNTLTFNHVGAIYRLSLDDVPAGTDKITVTFDKDVTGTFTVTDPDTDAPYIVTTGGSTGRTVTFNLSSALTAETDGFVLNVPVPTGTYSGNIKVAATGGGLARAQIFNSRAISRAMGQKLAETLVIPLFGGPFDGLYLSRGDLYLKTAGSDFAHATFALYDDPFKGYNTNYNKTPTPSQSSNVANRSYFNWLELGTLFSTAEVSTSSMTDIDNTKVPTGISSGFKVPTQSQWASIAGTSRTGATVNGGADKYHYSWIRITEAPYYYLVIFPDGANITLSGTIPARDVANSDSAQTISADDYDTMDAAGCVFLPYTGRYQNNIWEYGATEGRYWSASSRMSSDAYVMNFYRNGIYYSNNTNKSLTYCPVRLIQE